MRDSIVFYRSFYEAVKTLPPEDFKKTIQAIMEYGLNDVEPETNGVEKTVFLLVKPQIDANNRRYENGKRGGSSSKGKSETKPEPKANQSGTKVEPNVNQNGTKHEPNVNVNVNVNDNVKENTLKSVKEKRFAPPTLENVMGYCQEMGYSIDTQRFIDFYESKGWMVGKNKMKDWKAAVRNWARQDKEQGKTAVKSSTSNRFHNFDQTETDYNALVMHRLQCRLGGENDSS